MPISRSTTERRAEFLPELAAVFAQFGYRRTRTAQLAEACGVQETILYRLWPDKRAMFIAAVEHVFSSSQAVWERMLDRPGRGTVAERLLRYEAEHHGEHRLYRIVFAGLSEADDVEIRAALRRMYGAFARFVAAQVAAHRGVRPEAAEVREVAWALVGLGTVANVTRELELLDDRQRQQLLARIGGQLLGSSA